MTKGLSLRLLGRPSVIDDTGSAIAGLPEKSFVLLALLALGQPDGLTRTAAASRLWEDSEAAQCGANLRQLLFRVRRVEQRLGQPLFGLEGDHITLGNSIADCDVRRLLATEGIESAGAMHTLTRIYAGDLLQGNEEPGKKLQAWIEGERERLGNWFSQLVLDGVRRVDPLTGGIALRHLVDLTPPSVEAGRALLRHLIANGKTWEARRYLHDLAQRLGDDGPRLFAEETILLRHATPGVAAAPRLVGQHAGETGRAAAAPRVALLFSAETVLPARLITFAQALIEDITIGLTRLRSFAVLASHSAAQIGKAADLQLAEYYDIDYVVTARLAADPAAADRTRLAVLLERIPTRDMLWADRYAFSIEDGPARYSEITNTLTAALADKIERSELRSFETTDNPSAYALHLGGQNRLKNMQLPDIRRARKLFRDALDIAPDFSPALGGISQSLLYEWMLRGGHDSELLVRARYAATRAVELDPLDGNAHRMLGRAMLFEGGFDESIAEFERAQRLAPNHADLLSDYADTLMHNSDPNAANLQIEQALRLNPLAPDAYWWASGGIKFFLGQYEAALNHLQRLSTDEPVLRLIAACAAMAGQPQLAKSARIRAMAIDPGFKLDEWIAVLPQREEVHRNHYYEALKAAGFK